MKCETVQDDLSAYLDGELPADARSAVDAHIKDCPSCQTMLDELKSVASLVSESTRYSAPANFTETVHQRVAASPAPMILIGSTQPFAGGNTSGGYQPRSMWGPAAMGIAALFMLFVLAFAVMPALDKNSGAGLARRNAPRAAVEEPTGRPDPEAEVLDAKKEILESGLEQEAQLQKLQAAPQDLKKIEDGSVAGLDRLKDTIPVSQSKPATKSEKEETRGVGFGDALGGGKGEGALLEKSANAAPANGADATIFSATARSAAPKPIKESAAPAATEPMKTARETPEQALREDSRRLRQEVEIESKKLAGGNRNVAADKPTAIGGAPQPASAAATPFIAERNQLEQKREERKTVDAAPEKYAKGSEPPTEGAQARGARRSEESEAAPGAKAKMDGRAAPQPFAPPAPSAPATVATVSKAKKDVQQKASEELSKAPMEDVPAPAKKESVQKGRAGELDEEGEAADKKAGTATPKKQYKMVEEPDNATAGKAAQRRNTLLVAADKSAFLAQLKTVVEELGGEWKDSTETDRVEQAKFTLPAKNNETFYARLKDLKSAVVLDAAKADTVQKANVTISEESRSQTPDGKDIFRVQYANK